MTHLDVQETEYQQIEQYSRRARQHQRRGATSSPQLNPDFRKKQVKARLLSAVLWSLLFSLVSVANPFLQAYSSNLQSQNLYAGFAMQNGQAPYGDFFGTNGVLYYLLTWAGSFFGTTLVLGILQFIVLVIAGVYLQKIIGYFSQSRETAGNFLHWFYLCLLVVDLGGLDAVLFAQPFVLASLWFLIAYLEDGVKDEGFILYGIYGALVFLIHPMSSLLWVVASLVLLVYNIAKKRLARGFYQLLAGLFGFLLITYAVGYYTFIEQLLGAAIQQTFLYRMTLDFSSASLLWTGALVGGFVLLSGFFQHTIQTLFSLGKKENRAMKSLLLLTFLGHLLFLIGYEAFTWSDMVVLLPYGFMMAVVHLSPDKREQDLADEEALFVNYLSSSFYLPALVFLLLVAQPAYLFFNQQDANAERQMVATYIREHSESTDAIYAWDNRASLYVESERLAAASFLTPTAYLTTKANQDTLLFDLNKQKARYIVVNSSIPMVEGVRNNLNRYYEKVEIGTSLFSLYQKK